MDEVWKLPEVKLSNEHDAFLWIQIPAESDFAWNKKGLYAVKDPIDGTRAILTGESDGEFLKMTEHSSAIVSDYLYRDSVEPFEWQGKTKAFPNISPLEEFELEKRIYGQIV